MPCPSCGKPTRVVDSRRQEETCYRRRECKACKKRFSTQEISNETIKALKKRYKKEIRQDLEKEYLDLEDLRLRR
jgi:transcriptional regulator NrdR family protein